MRPADGRAVDRPARATSPHAVNSSSPAPSITARAIVIGKPARASAARSFCRFAARSPRFQGPSRLRRAALRAAASSSSSLPALAACASSRETLSPRGLPPRPATSALALQARRRDSAKRWSSTRPDDTQRATTSSSIASKADGVLLVMPAAHGDLARQHAAQLRGRGGIAFEIMHRRALEIIGRDLAWRASLGPSPVRAPSSEAHQSVPGRERPAFTAERLSLETSLRSLEALVGLVGGAPAAAPPPRGSSPAGARAPPRDCASGCADPARR